MRRTITLIVIITSLVASAAAAETLRGQVVHADGKTGYVNVAVTLDGGGKTGTVYTASDGMFYLQNVKPGEYTLSLRSANDAKAIKVVVAAKPYTDLPPVAMR